jgi:hypothetical protein
MVMRDEAENRSRMRLLLPFSVEKPGFSVGASIIRAWANPFGPLGTPLLDREDAAETLDNMLEAFAKPEMPVSLAFWFFPTCGSTDPSRACCALLQWAQPVRRRYRSGHIERPFLDSDA